jgi:cation:H+ antiporter
MFSPSFLFFHLLRHPKGKEELLSAILLEVTLLPMLGWLGVLVISSFLLSFGAEGLAGFYGARFVGRSILSIATTIPEIAIVLVAAVIGSFDVALGSALGSNLLMMTLGLSIMLIIATTRLSKAPLRQIDVKHFKVDEVLLIASAAIGTLLFINGYNFIDGIIFSLMFVLYVWLAFREMKVESKALRLQEQALDLFPEESQVGKREVDTKKKRKSNSIPSRKVKLSLALVLGTVGIAIGTEPFIVSLEQVSIQIGMPVVILAVLVSPIAGEMPEKISMMLLARKGATGTSIAVANVLGSKILNNTLLFALAIFGAVVGQRSISAIIRPNSLLWDQMILVTVITFAALIPFFREKLRLSAGIFLFSLYIVGVLAQFFLF